MARLDDELIEEVEELAEALRDGGISEVRSEIFGEAEEEDENEFFIRVVSPAGETLASTNMSSWSNIEFNQSKLSPSEDEDNHAFQTVSVHGREHNARVLTAAIGPEEIMQMGVILEDEEEYLEVFRNLFYALFLLLAFLSAMVGWLIARKGLHDVEEVTRTAMEISSGSPEKRVKINNQYEEIERLGRAFNMMLDRIQTIHRAIREINDNIAHDLRSPVARIRGIAEMTLMEKKSVEDFKDMAVSTVEECDSLIDMINTMLEITEAEAGVVENRMEEFDLIKLISEACEIFQPMAESKQHVIKINGPNTLNFRGDVKKVQRIVTNLLENAIKYTPDQGTITMSVLKHDDKIEIMVEDTGIGISEEELPRIFERFYRSKRSRSSGGNGLGLSLAKAFVASLGGAISARSTLGKGSTFVVTFAN
jgi:signal transduction histidine kinase